MSYWMEEYLRKINKSVGVTTASSTSKKFSLQKLEKMPETKGVISLKKSVERFNGCMTNLQKTTGFNANEHTAKVAVCLDYSGSAKYFYKYGTMQKVLERLMPIALQFDDNGELDVWIFDTGFHRIGGMTLDNFETYIQDEIVAKGYEYGGTKYAPVLKDVMKKYFVEDATPINIPVFLIFITDGDNWDTAPTTKVIRESSAKNIFIDFIGVGNENFKYLMKLDDLPNRECDNTAFFKQTDINKMTDEELFGKLFEQYPAWLKAKGLL